MADYSWSGTDPLPASLRRRSRWSELQWKDGEYERIEARNRAALKEVEQFTEPEWREVVSSDGVRCFVTRSREVSTRVDGVPSDWRPCAPRSPILDDLSIPDFLKR
jgi:hypothetical protein